MDPVGRQAMYVVEAVEQVRLGGGVRVISAQLQSSDSIVCMVVVDPAPQKAVLVQQFEVLASEWQFVHVM